MFFAGEKFKSRQTSFQKGFDHQLYQQFASGDFTLDGSGFYRSPYEIFRDNVANFCDRFMCSSFESIDCMTSEEKAVEAFLRNNGANQVQPCSCREETDEQRKLEDSRCAESRKSVSTTLDRTGSLPKSLSDTHIFSAVTLSFEPAMKNEDEKSSLLKKISNLMNNYSSNRIGPFSGHPMLKLPLNPNKWTACECYVHNGKHNNCCQCQEPYHRTSCDCAQHSASHSYCCRCDVHLLQEYDEYLKKKRVLKLQSDQDTESDGDQRGFRVRNSSERLRQKRPVETRRFAFPRLRDASRERSHLDKPGTSVFQQKNDERQNTEHPCESCCKKLDDVYGSALREVHSMLVDVSRSLLPAARGDPYDTLIQQDAVHRHQGSFQEMAGSTGRYEDPGPVRPLRYTDDIVSTATRDSFQSDAAIQVNTYSNCLHLQLYRDSKDRYKQGQTKASLSLQHFLGVESGFTLDKESNTIAILCQDVTVVLAFDTRERLIQWQVKIASNLGEDQQYLIQIGSAPPKAKIAPGPARLHIQEYRFSLTMGVPPRLIGVWTISQLRRYGVVDNRFCFEGGSTCGRLEGVYVLVSDQGEEITKAFKAASEGKLIPKRKQASRNSTVSVTESPRRRAGSRVKSMASTEQCEQSLPVSMWENMENQDTSECGDTVSVLDLNIDPLPSESWTGENAPCQSCKVGNMPRSLTVFNTPGTGFNPAWIMEAISGDHESNRNTICCNASVISESRSSDDSGCRSRAVSPCGVPPTCLVHENRNSKCLSHSSSESNSYENYDTPRNICATVADPNRSSIISSAEEYYDTPKKIKESLLVHQHHTPLAHPIQVCSCQPVPICRHVCAPAPVPQTCAHCNPPRIRCRCHMVQICSCQNVIPCAPKPAPAPVTCSCAKEVHPPCQIYARDPQPIAASAIYAKVDLLKKTKRKETSEVPEPAPKPTAVVVKETPHYANMGFAQSLEYYENLKDLRVRVDKFCTKCQNQHQEKEKVVEKAKVEEEYLVMGPVCESRNDANVPPYLHMKPIDSGKCSCPMEHFKEPLSTQAQSAATSPCLRRHDPSSCYATNERRRMAQIRRRSNSMDSGRYLDGLENINTKTCSSTHNTLTPNSQNNSVDSIPSQQDTPKKVLPAKPEVNLLDFRRPSSVPCKANRDSSASNDSGVSTGSLKNFGGGFLEFETIITPLSKVRQRSLDAMPLVLPRRSKSSDPLEELTFKFNKAEIKSSSAEAEVPICPPKKDCSKDISVSSSSGALTIPYIDSISSSSGASDMSDYIETLSMSSYSSSEHDNLRHCHSAVTFLRPRSGKEYQKIDRSNLEYGKAAALQGAQHTDSPSPGYVSSTSSN